MGEERAYTPQDVDLLTAIRTDIMMRPNAFGAGETFLKERYGPKRLHQDTLAVWERLKDHPTEKASHEASAQHRTRGIANPTEREARHREILEQVSAPPRPEQWTPAACACQAIQELRGAMNGEHHDAKAQAVLLLAVMLWDSDADKRHSIFSLFGPWGATPAGEIESVSRCTATFFLHHQADLRRWMDTVRMAWMALPKPVAVAATVEAVGNLTQADAEHHGAASRGMPWQHAKKAAEDHCARNPFPGFNALAKIVGCSPSTIRKAIDHSPKLREKAAEHNAQRRSVSARAMTEEAAASARQSRERDPAEAASTDEILRALIEQGTEQERAELHEKTPAQLQAMVASMDDEYIRELFKPRTR